MYETMGSTELLEMFAGKLGENDANVIVSFLKKLLNGIKSVFNSKDEFPNKFSDIIGMFEGAVKNGVYNASDTGYNNTKYSYKHWHTNLSNAEVSLIENWLKKARRSENNTISKKSHWYEGFLDGDDLFVIYSTERTNDPTILYLATGTEAIEKKQALRKIMEVAKNEISAVERKRIIDGLLGGNWNQAQRNLANSDNGFGDGDVDIEDAPILQRTSSKPDGDATFEDVVRTLLKRREQERKGREVNKKFALSGNTGSGNGYNGRTKMTLSSDKWVPKIGKARLEKLKARVKSDIRTSQNEITDTANWIFREIDGAPVFAIYSTEDANNPVIEYLARGREGNKELNSLLDVLEEIENEKRTRAVRKQTFADRVLIRDWVPNKFDLANNNDRLGGGSSSVGNASILQGKSSKLVGSKTFRFLIEDLLQREARITNKEKNFSLKDNEDSTITEVSYSLKKVINEGYSTEGTKWAVANSLLTKEEQALFWKNIADLSKRGYYVPKSKNGQYIIDVGRKLIFTNGDFKSTTMSNIIEFADGYETNIFEYKELIINEERNTAQHRDSMQIIEIVQGEGYVREYNQADYRTDARKIGNGKGKDSRENSSIKGDDVKKSYSLKETWHTDLTKSQLKMVDGWLRKAGTPETKRIADTAFWYKGRIGGDDLFVIYSTEDSAGPTILYEIKGKKAMPELNILLRRLEEYEYGERERAVGKSQTINTVLSGSWMQQTNGIQNRTTLNRGTSNKNVGVLQGQSQGNASRALWNVIENLFGISDDRGISYSLKDAESNILSEEQHYTEKEYRNFGWARANNILNAGQNADYRSKFADAKVGRAKFVKSKKGEYIIPVSDINDPDFEGIDNVLVFAKGTISNPIITSVIEIYEYDETSIDRIRRQIYDGERRGVQQTSGKLFGRHFASDFKFQSNQQRTGTESSGNSSNDGYGRRSGEEVASAQGETEVNFSLKEGSHTFAVDTKELLDTIEQLKHEFELTKFAKADPKKLSEMTKRLLRDYDSKADLDETLSVIDELYTYIANGEDGHPPVWNEVYERANKAARSIVEYIQIFKLTQKASIFIKIDAFNFVNKNNTIY